MRFGLGFAPFFAAARLFAAANGTTTIVDGSGNVWLTGATNSLLPTANALQKTLPSRVCGSQTLSPFDQATPLYCQHAYLKKQDSAGNVLYATYLGGGSQDGGTAITVDVQGNVYVAGYTYSSDFPVTSGAAQTKNNGPVQPVVYVEGGFPFGPANVVAGGDVFVAKFAPDGTLLFSTLLGGSGLDVPLLIGVDGANSVYVAGFTNSTDFPTAGDAITPQHATTFFARLNPTGTAIVYSTYSAQSILAFDADPQGRAYLTGTSSATNGAYLTVVDTSTGSVVRSVSLPTIAPKIAGAGVAIAVNVAAGDLFLAISPAPPPYNWFLVTQPPRQLGPSYLLDLPLDASRVLAETDVSQAQFDSILLDASGDAYAFGHGTGPIPRTPISLLSAPCSPQGGSFVLESNPSGKIIAATYFRQGNDAGVSVTSPGHILVYRMQSPAILPSTVVALDVSGQPAANFECPKNLASGVVGAGLAPGEIFLLTGNGLGPERGISAAPNDAGQYPRNLGGVQVLIGAVAVPLLYVQANEIHAVAPFALPNLPEIQVRYDSQSAPPLDAARAFINPGIFSIAGQGAVVNQDGTVNTPANAAQLGSIVSVYCTGTGYLEAPNVDGLVTPIPPPFITTEIANPVLTFAGVAGTTLWSGSAPGLIFGVTQINVRLPQVLPSGTVLSAVPMVLSAAGEQSPAVSISVKE